MSPWTQVNKYRISNGRCDVAALRSGGVWGYLLWVDGVMVHRCFATADEAKEEGLRRTAVELAA